MTKSAWQRALTLFLLLAFLVILGVVYASRSTLPDCSDIYSKVTKPVEDGVRQAVTKYYAEKKLTPITIYKNQEVVVDVKLWSVGVHECLNPGGGNGAYVGAVPKSASAAVQVYVFHKPYPVVQAPSHFLMLAKMGSAWTVVSEGTGP